MLTLEEAKSLALDYAHKQAPPGVDLVVLDNRTLAKPYGWVMVINTRAYALSGDPIKDALIGWGPVVVRHNGRIEILGSSGSSGRMLDAFEKKHGLRGG